MIIQTELGLISFSGPRGVIFLTKPRDCPTCKRAVMILVNEGGKTRCTTCPEET